jgi:hypothetical protein
MVILRKILMIFTLVLGLTLTGMPCGLKDGDTIKMRNSNPKEIRPVCYLEGFWQISHPPGNYLTIMERDAKQLQSTLSVWQFASGGWQLLKKITNEDVSIKDFDGYALGSKLFICTEVNTEKAIYLVSCDLAGFVEPKQERVPFSSVGYLSLTPEQFKKVNLPIPQQWSMASFLTPKECLFHPKFVRGETPAPWVVANTADGQAMIFSLDKDSRELEQFSIPNALEPQACIHQGKRYVAFKGTEGPVYPFWASQEPNPVKAPLKVVVDQGTATDLSATMGIGPVLGFAMALAAEGDLWIFALREAVLGTNVVALKKNGQKWTLAGEGTLEGDVERLSVENGGGVFHLVYAVRKGEGWSLRYQSWPMPR